MNMQPRKTIFRIRHGSHMYGTSTPDSDLDFKEVFLPSGYDIVMARVKDAVEQKKDKQPGEKNKAGDIDVQAFSLLKLTQMLVGGDIVGCELIFTQPEAILHIDPIYQQIIDNRDIFLSREVKGYVGYVQRQAAMYGIKGSRVAAAEGAMDLFLDLMGKHGSQTKVGEFPDLYAEFVANHEHSQLVVTENKQTGVAQHFLEVCDRKIMYTNTIKEAYLMYKHVYDAYGDRAKLAKTNEGLDWKALSHAVRVGNQAIELLGTGKITFPRPEAAYLLDIKQGRVPYIKIGQELEEILDRVQTMDSVLPPKPDYEKIDALRFKIYADQVQYSKGVSESE